MYREAPPSPPPPTLHTPEAIALATFLGSPLAGAALWALNEKRTGRPRAAWGALGLGVAATAALFVVGAYLPSGGSIGLQVGLVFGVLRLGREWVAKATADGRVGALAWAPKWKGAVAGLAMLVVVLGAIAGVTLFGPDAMLGRVEVRPGAYVYYENGVDADEARRLGAHLRAQGFFAGDRRIDVRYERADGGHALSLIVPRSGGGVADAEYEAFVRELRPATDPRGRLELRLCDDAWRPHRRFSAP